MTGETIEKRKEHTFQRIKTTILEKINTQEWKPGDRIPGEEALAAEFQCARMTVHRAMRELSEMGVIERKRRVGTRVALRRSRSMTFDIPRVDLEIAEMGQQYRYELIEQAIALPPERMRQRLKLPLNAEAMQLRCLHFANDVPWQLEERWLNIDAIPNSTAFDFVSTPPHQWLQDNLPWASAEHSVFALSAEPEQAQLLNISTHDVILAVNRRTSHNDTIITQATLYHPGRFYRLQTAPAAM